MHGTGLTGMQSLVADAAQATTRGGYMRQHTCTGLLTHQLACSPGGCTISFTAAAHMQGPTTAWAC